MINFFFIKQKTAYEIKECDWSSDVCSSDLLFGGICVCLIYVYYYGGGDTTNYYRGALAMVNLLMKDMEGFFSILAGNLEYNNWSLFEIGRASCRERV